MAHAKYKSYCGANTTGVASVFLATIPSLSAATLTITNGEVTAITAASLFKEFTGENDAVSFMDERAEGVNAIYNKTLSMLFGKPNLAQNTMINQLEADIPCGIMAIHQDGNGECWITGLSVAEGKTKYYNKMSVKRDTKKYGEQDGNKCEVVLKMISGSPAIPLSSTLAASVVARTAAFCDFNS